ncbi:uncharacterized protein N7498_003077 [Penicillium cinerascens]|uniref:Uncharacterized protein n=1 Tax=Penicillium cinerascens TaxID=70096 RepID=A0A9W9T6T3_9EURO|nr:uncharacterized protein N7498_003077 [Penicillium cinerascens]KAJ5211431.1 hypothetical protein N7498_003077 [Penicillium cinerascens]
MVTPSLHPEGWVKTVVRTNGSPDVEAAVVVLGVGVMSEVEVDEVELDKDDERRDVGDAVVLLVALTPEVVTPMVSS